MSPAATADAQSARPATLADELARLLAPHAGWSVRVDRTWARADVEGFEPRVQGWKLHLSATVRNAPDVLRAVVPHLVARRTPFKVARDLDVVAELTSRIAPRGGAGKVVTIYPYDDDSAVALADELDQATRGMAGPRILSDGRLHPSSLVHYRYGAFRGVRDVDADGSVQAALIGPDGRIVPDLRAPGHVGPGWAVNPFPVPGVPPQGQTVLLAQRFAVRSAIRHANRGGVFRAEDLVTGRTVAVKQARAHVGATAAGVDVQTLLRHEYGVLEVLGDTGWTPRPITLLEQNGDLFLVEEEIPGRTLRAWVNAGLVDGLPARERRENLAVLGQLVQLLADLHSRDVVVGDLSPQNLLVTPDGALRLIDLELATLPGGLNPHLQGGTPGYAAPERLSGAAPGPADDLHALGAMVLFVCTGEDPFLTRTASTASAWLDSATRRRACGDVLAPLATELLDPNPAARPSLVSVARRLAAGSHDAPLPTAQDEVAAALDDLTTLDSATVDAAIAGLLSRLRKDLDPGGDRLVPTSAFGETTLPGCVQHGAAGVLTVLVQAHETLGDATLLDEIDAVARWLDRAEQASQRGPVGLYFGHAGPAWALADAALALGDEALLSRAVQRVLALDRTWPAPDLTHGLAGLGLALIHIHDRTGVAPLLAAAGEVADTLGGRAEFDPNITWRTPREFSSSFAGSRSWGFAHGTAGIGTFLAASAERTGLDRHRAAADHARVAIERAAHLVAGTARWGSHPEQPTPEPAYWCNGSPGVLGFLLRSGADEAWVEAAARSVLAAKWRCGIAYCHGLAGNADALVDASEHTGRSDFRVWAAHLVARMWRLHSTDAQGVVLADDPTRVSADFNTGYAGALSTLLRLRHGGPRAYLPAAATSGGGR